MLDSYSVSLKQLFFSLFILFISWEFFSRFFGISAIPSPVVVVVHIFTNLSSSIFVHLAVSLYRIIISLFISIILAVPIGLILGRSKRADKLFSPYIYLLYPVPKISLLPIFLIVLGIGDLSKIFIIVSIVFFQLLVNVRDAAKTIPAPLIQSVESLGASRLELIRYVIFPACLPSILSCLRISLGTSLAVLFLVETYATNLGIGFYIMDALSGFDYPDVFSGIIMMSLMGFFLFFIIDFLEKRYCSWSVSRF